MMQVSAAPAELVGCVGVWGGGTGVTGPAGGNHRDKTHKLQAVDSHRADKRILLNSYLSF